VCPGTRGGSGVTSGKETERRKEKTKTKTKTKTGTGTGTGTGSSSSYLWTTRRFLRLLLCTARSSSASGLAGSFNSSSLSSPPPPLALSHVTFPPQLLRQSLRSRQPPAYFCRVRLPPSPLRSRGGGAPLLNLGASQSQAPGHVIDAKKNRGFRFCGRGRRARGICGR
jgi:hypothetical protein